MTYKELYARATVKGKLREDEYSTAEYIADVNDICRVLWTTIFQGVNGNKPQATRIQATSILNDPNFVLARTIKDTPILKIVFEGCVHLAQNTDKVDNIGNALRFSFEYDDDEIRFSEAQDGDYEIFYEEATYTELTRLAYDADASPDWLKANFHPILWSYPAWANTDTKKAEMGELYSFHKQSFDEYYSRTETLEENVMRAADTFGEQL